MKTKKEFVAFFKTEIEPFISSSDKPALRQAWNDTIDSMCKSDQLPDRARDWTHPKRFYKDEFEIQGDYGYGHGYECVTTEETHKEAKERLKEYRENEPRIPFKIVRKRVKKSVS